MEELRGEGDRGGLLVAGMGKEREGPLLGSGGEEGTRMLGCRCFQDRAVELARRLLERAGFCAEEAGGDWRYWGSKRALLRPPLLLL